MERFFSNIMRKYGTRLTFLEITRPWNAVAPGLLGFLGYLLGGGNNPFEIAMIFSLFFFAYMAASTVNDIYDEFIDKINMPYRPLQEGRIKRKSAFNLSLALHIITLIMGFTLGWRAFLLSILVLLLSFIYSAPPIAFSRRGVASQIELSITMCFIPLLTGVILSLNSFLVPLNVLFFIASLTSIFVFIFIIKDFKDVFGDKTYNKKTLLLQIGKKKTKIISLTGSFISFILILYFFYEIFTFSFIQSLILLVILSGILYQEINVEKDPEKTFGLARLFVMLMLLSLMATPLGFF